MRCFETPVTASLAPTNSRLCERKCHTFQKKVTHFVEESAILCRRKCHTFLQKVPYLHFAAIKWQQFYVTTITKTPITRAFQTIGGSMVVISRKFSCTRAREKHLTAPSKCQIRHIASKRRHLALQPASSCPATGPCC